MATICTVSRAIEGNSHKVTGQVAPAGKAVSQDVAADEPLPLSELLNAPHRTVSVQQLASILLDVENLLSRKASKTSFRLNLEDIRLLAFDEPERPRRAVYSPAPRSKDQSAMPALGAAFQLGYLACQLVLCLPSNILDQALCNVQAAQFLLHLPARLATVGITPTSQLASTPAIPWRDWVRETAAAVGQGPDATLLWVACQLRKVATQGAAGLAALKLMCMAGELLLCPEHKPFKQLMADWRPALKTMVEWAPHSWQGPHTCTWGSWHSMQLSMSAHALSMDGLNASIRTYHSADEVGCFMNSLPHQQLRQPQLLVPALAVVQPDLRAGEDAWWMTLTALNSDQAAGLVLEAKRLQARRYSGSTSSCQTSAGGGCDAAQATSAGPVSQPDMAADRDVTTQLLPGETMCETVVDESPAGRRVYHLKHVIAGTGDVPANSKVSHLLEYVTVVMADSTPSAQMSSMERHASVVMDHPPADSQISQVLHHVMAAMDASPADSRVFHVVQHMMRQDDLPVGSNVSHMMQHVMWQDGSPAGSQVPEVVQHGVEVMDGPPAGSQVSGVVQHGVEVMDGSPAGSQVPEVVQHGVEVMDGPPAGSQVPEVVQHVMPELSDSPADSQMSQLVKSMLAGMYESPADRHVQHVMAGTDDTLVAAGMDHLIEVEHVTPPTSNASDGRLTIGVPGVVVDDACDSPPASQTFNVFEFATTAVNGTPTSNVFDDLMASLVPEAVMNDACDSPPPSLTFKAAEHATPAVDSTPAACAVMATRAARPVATHNALQPMADPPSQVGIPQAKTVTNWQDLLLAHHNPDKEGDALRKLPGPDVAYVPATADQIDTAAVERANEIMGRFKPPGGQAYVPITANWRLLESCVGMGYTAQEIALGSYCFQRVLAKDEAVLRATRISIKAGYYDFSRYAGVLPEGNEVVEDVGPVEAYNAHVVACCAFQACVNLSHKVLEEYQYPLIPLSAVLYKFMGCTQLAKRTALNVRNKLECAMLKALDYDVMPVVTTPAAAALPPPSTDDWCAPGECPPHVMPFRGSWPKLDAA